MATWTKVAIIGKIATCCALGAADEHVPFGIICRVDHAYYEEIAGVLRGLVIRLDDRLRRKDITWIGEFIDANELGLALDQMADALSEADQPLAADERADMLALADRMQMGDRIARALSFCPPQVT